MSGKRRRPYAVRKTVGWHVNPETGKSVQEQITIGYAATRAEGLQMLAEYNNNPFDIKASKATFQEVYERDVYKRQQWERYGSRWQSAFSGPTD